MKVLTRVDHVFQTEVCAFVSCAFEKWVIGFLWEGPSVSYKSLNYALVRVCYVFVKNTRKILNALMLLLVLFDFSCSILLYRNKFSMLSRIPFALPFESQISRLKDSVHSSEEDAVKTVFTNDVAHNNRLLGLLVDSGVTGCVLLGDGADLTPALSEHLKKLSCSGVDDDLKTSSFMSDVLLEEVACGTETVKENDTARPKEQDFSNSPPEIRDMPTSTTSPFRWGTLPCAACGLLCFPSMAIVQPASNIENGLYPAKHIHVGASGHLSSFFMEEEDHAPDTGHLPSFLTKNDEDLQSEFPKTPFSEAVYHPVASLAHVKLEQEKFLQWEVKQDAIQALHKKSQDDAALRGSLQVFQVDQKYKICGQNENSCSNGKALDLLHGEVKKTNGIVHFVYGFEENGSGFLMFVFLVKHASHFIVQEVLGVLLIFVYPLFDLLQCFGRILKRQKNL